MARLGREFKKAAETEDPVIEWYGATVELESVVERSADGGVRFWVASGGATSATRTRSRSLSMSDHLAANPWLGACDPAPETDNALCASAAWSLSSSNEYSITLRACRSNDIMSGFRQGQGPKCPGCLACCSCGGRIRRGSTRVLASWLARPTAWGSIAAAVVSRELLNSSRQIADRRVSTDTSLAGCFASNYHCNSRQKCETCGACGTTIGPIGSGP